MSHKPFLVSLLFAAALLLGIDGQSESDDRSDDPAAVAARPGGRVRSPDPSIAALAAGTTLTVCSTCPYTTIGSALAAAGNNDSIRVASGAYPERLLITKTVTLEGGWDISFTARTPGSSVVDAQRLGRVVTIIGPITSTLDGLTIVGGDATNEITGTHQGGGVYVQADGALLIHNVITNNLATTSDFITKTGQGGGIFVHGASGTVVISANQIMSNVAGAGGPGTQAQGGGVFAGGTTMLIDNLIASNQARLNHTLYGYGGGAYVYNGVVRGNQFIGNSASNGGAIAEAFGSTTFEANLSRGHTGGNGLLEPGSGSRVKNNFLLEANCPNGVAVYVGDVEIVNNTIAGCLTGVYVGSSASTLISNTLFYSNTTAIAADGTPLLDYNGFWLNGIDFNVMTGTLTGTHNVFADPLFVDPITGDFHLGSGSPMIDHGTGAGAPSSDYDGNARPAGSGVDIGADEFVPTYQIDLPLILKNS